MPWRRPARCGGSRVRPASSVCRTMTREEVFSLIQTHLADELDLDPARIDGGHPLQGRPRCGLARPLHARAGARGLLRRPDVRRGRGARSSRSGRPSTSSSTAAASVSATSKASRPPRGAAGGAAPAGVHARVVDRAALGLLLAAGVPGRLGARPGGDARTCSRAWRPSASAPAG